MFLYFDNFEYVLKYRIIFWGTIYTAVRAYKVEEGNLHNLEPVQFIHFLGKMEVESTL